MIDLPRLSGPVTLDGQSDEEAWGDIEPLQLTMYEPTFRGASDRDIQVLVGYDDEALYVAARFYHDDPRSIRAFSLTRDRWSGDDGFGVLLDTFNDNENAVRFVGLPLGTRMDMTITDGGAGGEGGGGNGGGGPRNSSWNAFWDLETVQTDEGWFGEMRIPFSTLRFETAADGTVVMGMMAYAYEPGEASRWTFPAIPQDFPYTQISTWQDVRFRDIEPRNPIYVSPYALTGRSRAAELNAGGTAWQYAENDDLEFGGDVKLNPTPNLTLDLTVNTDFAAVEADQQQINLTRFSLFFDEKRPFFQERAGLFGFETGADRGTLFYSRRIGLTDGRPVPILGGARLVGRVGSWDLGAIAMQTAEVQGLPSENFGVLRLKRRVLNENSFVGAMSTSRLSVDGEYNVTYGLDGLVRALGDEYLTVKWLQTFQGGSPTLRSAPDGLHAARVVVDWTRRKLGGLSYQHAFTYSGPGYDPAVGFELRSDFTRVQSDWNYQWFPDESSAFRRFWIGLQSSGWLRNQDDEMETGQIQPFVQLETKPGTTFKLSMNTQYEDVLTPFPLSADVAVPAGSYWATEGIAEFRAPRGWNVRPNITVTAGEFFDGRRVGLGGDLSWSINEYLELRGGWEWNRIRFDTRGQEFDSNLLRLTARGALNPKFSVDVFGQYNSLSEVLTTNTRLRYNFAEGQDLWLVWNEGLNLEREVFGVPRLPLEGARTLTIKYTHTFVF
ncbi:MAG: carbohydrate binding family 9 domain-containing protein [Gemmatimonadota bacterium]|nr:carbohydrate binding family 9 domain-containing protein [Gemmatimonadota bacterium]